ncbi:hypothetical protein CLF_111467, partial [Clonorchis sinensis]
MQTFSRETDQLPNYLRNNDDPVSENTMDMCSCEVVSIREYISEVAETTEVIEGPLLSPVVDRFTSIYERRMKPTYRREGGVDSWLAHQKCKLLLPPSTFRCRLPSTELRCNNNPRQRDLSANYNRKTTELPSHSSDDFMRLRSFSEHDVVHKEEETYQLEVKPGPVSPPQCADTTESPLYWPWTRVNSKINKSPIRYLYPPLKTAENPPQQYTQPPTPPFVETSNTHAVSVECVRLFSLPFYSSKRTSILPKGHDLRRPSSRKIKVYSKPVNFSDDWKEGDSTDRKIVLESRVLELEAQKQSLEKSVEVLKVKLKAAENEIQAAKLDLTDFVPRKLFLEQADELATEKERALQLKLKCGELESARLLLDEELSTACAQFEAKRQSYEKRIQNLEEELEERVTGVSELKNPSPGLPSVTPVTPRTQNSQDQNSFHEGSELRRVEKNMWSEKPSKGANMRDVCDAPDRNWEDQRRGDQQDMERKLDGTGKLPLKSPVNNTDGKAVPLEENKTSVTQFLSAFRFPPNRVQYTNGDQEDVSHLDYANGNIIDENEHDGTPIKKGSQRKIIPLQTKIAQIGQRSDASAKTKLVQTDPCENGLHETQRMFELPHWEREFPLEDTDTLSDYKPTGLPSTRIYSPSSDGGDKLYEVTDLKSEGEVGRKCNNDIMCVISLKYPITLATTSASEWNSAYKDCFWQGATKQASYEANRNCTSSTIQDIFADELKMSKPQLSSQYPLTRRPRPKTSLPPNYRCQPTLQLQAERNALVHFVADTIAAVVDANNNECSQIAKQLGLQPIHTKLPGSILSVRGRNCHLRPGAQNSPFYLSFMRDIAWQNWTAVLAESLAGLSASCGMALKKVELQTEELFRKSKHLADTRSLIARQIQLMQDLQQQARNSRMNRRPQSKKKRDSSGVSVQGLFPGKRGLLDQDTRIRYTNTSFRGTDVICILMRNPQNTMSFGMRNRMSYSVEPSRTGMYFTKTCRNYCGEANFPLNSERLEFVEQRYVWDSIEFFFEKSESMTSDISPLSLAWFELSMNMSSRKDGLGDIRVELETSSCWKMRSITLHGTLVRLIGCSLQAIVGHQFVDWRDNRSLPSKRKGTFVKRLTKHQLAREMRIPKKSARKKFGIHVWGSGFLAQYQMKSKNFPLNSERLEFVEQRYVWDSIEFFFEKSESMTSDISPLSLAWFELSMNMSSRKDGLGDIRVELETSSCWKMRSITLHGTLVRLIGCSLQAIVGHQFVDWRDNRSLPSKRKGTFVKRLTKHQLAREMRIPKKSARKKFGIHVWGSGFLAQYQMKSKGECINAVDFNAYHPFRSLQWRIRYVYTFIISVSASKAYLPTTTLQIIGKRNSGNYNHFMT